MTLILFMMKIYSLIYSLAILTALYVFIFDHPPKLNIKPNAQTVIEIVLYVASAWAWF